MEPKSRMPQLAYPFAIVGAAAGWLCAGFFSDPLVGVSIGGNQYVAAACATINAGALGWALSRWCRNREKNPFRGDHGVWFRVAVCDVIAGALAGAFTQILMAREMIWLAALDGALSGLAFLPLCLAVVAAARRAERARHGSIVAAADRREVWAILAAGVAVATLIAVPAWLASMSGLTAPPYVAAAILFAATAVSAGLFGLDAIAFALVHRTVAGRDLEKRESNDHCETVPHLDLGLGDDLLARVTRRAAAYRSRDRATLTVLGDPDEALAAMRRSVRRGAASLGVVALAVIAHVYAWNGGGLYSFHDFRCMQGVSASCELAADLVREHGEASPQSLVDTLDRSCALGAAAGCRAYGEILARGDSGLLPDMDRATSAFSLGCRLDDAGSCREFGRIELAKVRGYDTANRLGDGLRALDRACTLARMTCVGKDCMDAPACEEARITRAAFSATEEKRDALLDCVRDGPEACTSAARLDFDDDLREQLRAYACHMSGGKSDGCSSGELGAR